MFINELVGLGNAENTMPYDLITLGMIGFVYFFAEKLCGKREDHYKRRVEFDETDIDYINSLNYSSNGGIRLNIQGHQQNNFEYKYQIPENTDPNLDFLDNQIVEFMDGRIQIVNPFPEVFKLSSIAVSIQLPERWLQNISLAGVKATIGKLTIQNDYQSITLAPETSLIVNHVAFDTESPENQAVINVDLQSSSLILDGNFGNSKIILTGLLIGGSTLQINTSLSNLDMSELNIESGSTVLTLSN